MFNGSALESIQGRSPLSSLLCFPGKFIDRFLAPLPRLFLFADEFCASKLNLVRLDLNWFFPGIKRRTSFSCLRYTKGHFRNGFRTLRTFRAVSSIPMNDGPSSDSQLFGLNTSITFGLNYSLILLSLSIEVFFLFCFVLAK